MSDHQSDLTKGSDKQHDIRNLVIVEYSVEFAGNVDNIKTKNISTVLRPILMIEAGRKHLPSLPTLNYSVYNLPSPDLSYESRNETK